jgi:hypothetical protein
VSSAIPFKELCAGDLLIITIPTGKTLELQIDQVHIHEDDGGPRSGLVVNPLRVGGSPHFKKDQEAVLRFMASGGRALEEAKGLCDVANKSTIEERDFGFLTQNDTTGNFLVKSVELRREPNPAA